MTVTARRLFYLSATLVFGLTSPLLLLYAQGYRMDFKHVRVIRTGGLLITSFPDRAAVTIDGSVLGSTTPRLHTGLYPGSYEVTVQREGFQTWREHVQIIAQKITALEATLLPTHPAITSFAITRTMSYSYDPHGKKLAIAHSPEHGRMRLSTIDTKTNAFHDIAEMTGIEHGTPQLSWSRQGTYLSILVPGKNFAILRSENATRASLPVTPPLTRIAWSPSEDQLLYGSDGESLWAFNIQNSSSWVTASPHVADFAPETNNVWIVRSSQESSMIELMNPLEPNDVIESRTIKDKLLRIHMTQGNRMVVQSASTVYLLNLRTDANTSLTISGVVKVRPDGSGQIVLMKSPTEIWGVDFNDMAFELLARESNIDDAIWYPRSSVALILSHNVLNARKLRTPLASFGRLGPFDQAQSLQPIDNKRIALVGENGITIVDLW